MPSWLNTWPKFVLIRNFGLRFSKKPVFEAIRMEKLPQRIASRGCGSAHQRNGSEKSVIVSTFKPDIRQLRQTSGQSRSPCYSGLHMSNQDNVASSFRNVDA